MKESHTNIESAQSYFCKFSLEDLEHTALMV